MTIAPIDINNYVYLIIHQFQATMQLFRTIQTELPITTLSLELQQYCEQFISKILSCYCVNCIANVILLRYTLEWLYNGITILA